MTENSTNEIEDAEVLEETKTDEQEMSPRQTMMYKLRELRSVLTSQKVKSGKKIEQQYVPYPILHYKKFVGSKYGKRQQILSDAIMSIGIDPTSILI